MSFRAKVKQHFNNIQLTRKEDARKWLFCCIHAVHLGLLTKDKLQEAVRICKTIYKQVPSKKAVFDDWKVFEFDKPVRLENTDYSLSFDFWRHTVNDDRAECHLCVECNRCHCGCGKTDIDFKRLANLARTKLINEATLKCHAEWGYSSKQIQILRTWQTHCKHGRHDNLSCNCCEGSILAEFGESRAWRIPDKHDRALITKCLKRIDYPSDALTLEEKKLLRRHFLTCSTFVANHFFDGCGCWHSSRFWNFKAFATFLAAIHKEVEAE